MGRKPCCEKVGLKKGPWTEEEDRKLIDFITKNGHCCWRAVPERAGLARCGKSCRLRWTNYLRPDLKRGFLSETEEQIIIDLHSSLGNRWSKIASHLPGRTDNEIKNHWNTHIKKKLKRMGIDPQTHGPISSSAASSDNSAANENQKGPAAAADTKLPCSPKDTQTETKTTVMQQQQLNHNYVKAEEDEITVDVEQMSSMQQLLTGDWWDLCYTQSLNWNHGHNFESSSSSDWINPHHLFSQ